MVTIDELYKIAEIVSALNTSREYFRKVSLNTLSDSHERREHARSQHLWENYNKAFLDAAELYKENVIQELKSEF